MSTSPKGLLKDGCFYVRDIDVVGARPPLKLFISLEVVGKSTRSLLFRKEAQVLFREKAHRDLYSHSVSGKAVQHSC